MINQCGYHNKMDIDNLMNYPGENEACSGIQSLEDIVSTIIENNAEDDDEDDTVSFGACYAKGSTYGVEHSSQLYDTIQKYNTSAIGCNKKS